MLVDWSRDKTDITDIYKMQPEQRMCLGTLSKLAM